MLICVPSSITKLITWFTDNCHAEESIRIPTYETKASENKINYNWTKEWRRLHQHCHYKLKQIDHEKQKQLN